MPRLRRRGAHANLVGASGATWGARCSATRGRSHSISPFLDCHRPSFAGALLRTSEPASAAGGIRPVVVSVGHGLSLPSALGVVRRCSRHRIPEPVRQADLRSREWLREHGAAAEEEGEG